MTLTISTALAFAVITIALIWSKKVGAGTALFVWLSGFTVAGTGLSGPVNAMLATLVHAIHH